MLLLGLIWLLHVMTVTVCGSTLAVWSMVYVMVCMHTLWLQVCGVVNDKSTTGGTMAQSFNLLTLSVTKHDTSLSLSLTNGILDD